MIKKRIKYSISIIVLAIILGTFFQSTNAEQVFQNDEMITYIKLITEPIDKTFQWTETENYNLHSVFKTVCEELKNDNIGIVTFNGTNTSSTYSAKDSVFVTIMCNSILAKQDNKQAQDKDFPLNTLLKQHNIRGLWLACLTTENTAQTSDPNCENWARNNSTDFSFIFYNLSSQIFNDVLNFMTARVYGAIHIDADKKDLANAYIVNYFNTVAFLPESKSYPQTYKKLSEYITLWKNMQQSTLLFDVKNIGNAEFSDTSERKNFLMYNSQVPTNGDTNTKTLANYEESSINILYNELFFYTLFSQIYSTQLERFWRDSASLPTAFKNRNDIKWAISIQRSRIQNQDEKLLWSLSQSIRQINTTVSTFPVHIWLLMYQEDLLTLRNNLAKIYLPIHQLHYKLENVQSKD